MKNKTATNKTTKLAKVDNAKVSTFVQGAMHVYGSHVNGERAVPDGRDGLKPVQRRILYGMLGLGASPTKAPLKSARVVGEVMGLYHPHGDGAIYGTLVSMHHARNPLVEGSGNFGDRVGTTEVDPPAPMRYTEARLTPLGVAVMEDIADAQMVDSYDGLRQEPVFLPARVPMVLANGTVGIGYGMAVNIPPHNLGETIEASIAMVKNPKATTDDLLQFIKGPDHGYGVLMSTPADILALYKKGEGSLEYRCDYKLEDKGGEKLLVITSPAPGWSPSRFLKLMSKLAEEKLILRAGDRTSKGTGFRIEVAYNDARVLTQRLLPALSTTESYKFYAVERDGGETLSAETLKAHTLRSSLKAFVEFRIAMETARTKRLLKIARKNVKRERAMLVGTLNVKTVAAIVDDKKNADLPAMCKALCKALNKSLSAKLKLDDESAEMILQTPIWKLGRMNVPGLKKKIAELVAEINTLLADLKHIDKVVIRRLEEMRKFSTPRGTKLRVKAATVNQSVGAGYVVARSNGQVKQVGATIPDTKGSPYDFAVKVKDSAIVVGAKGSLRRFSLAYSTDEKVSGGAVGIAKDTDAFVALVDESGKGVAVDLDKLSKKKDDVPALKGQRGQIVSAAGIGKGESLLAVCKSGAAYLIPAGDVKTTRAGVLAYAVAGGGREKVVQLARVPQGAVVVSEGAVVKFNKKGEAKLSAKVPAVVVGLKNYAMIRKDKGLHKQADVLAALKKGKCTNVVAL